MSSGHILSPEQLVHAWPGVGVGGELSSGIAADEGHPGLEGPFGAGL